MYANAEFFAAPFLDRDKFGSWVLQLKKSDIKKFSRQLHRALETSKPISIEDKNPPRDYRIAIVGPTVSKTGNFSKKYCLLSGYSDPLFRVLHSNPKLVSTIKTHMSSNFFENWYSMQSERIKNKRTKCLKKFDLLTKKLDHDIERYQAIQLEDIRSSFPAGVILIYDYDGHASSYEKDGSKKPTKIIIENSGDTDISELKLLVDKFNNAQSIREILRNPSLDVFSRLNQFSVKIQDRGFNESFTANNDSEGKKLLKTLGYAVTTLLFGLGIYLSYKNKGTYRFWKSGEEALLESTQEHFDMQIKRLANPKVWGK